MVNMAPFLSFFTAQLQRLRVLVHPVVLWPEFLGCAVLPLQLVAFGRPS